MAELLGTFTLVFVDAGISVLNAISPEPLGVLPKILAPGFVVMTMIFILGEISGAHINPAVTFAFAIRKVFPWKKVPLYLFMQIAGAVLAILLLKSISPEHLNLAANESKIGFAPGWILELLMTSLLITTILVTSCESRIKGFESGFPVGFTIIFCGFIGKALTGSSINPARYLGPAIVLQNFTASLTYLLVPFIAAFIGLALTTILIGQPTAKEYESAQGAS